MVDSITVIQMAEVEFSQSGDYRAVGNVDGTCSYGTGASGQVDPSDYAAKRCDYG